MTEQELATHARLNMLEFMIAHLYATWHGEIPKPVSDFAIASALDLQKLHHIRVAIDDPASLAIAPEAEELGRAFVARVAARADQIRVVKAQIAQEAAGAVKN